MPELALYPKNYVLVMESTFLPRVDDHEFYPLVNLRQALLLLAETIDYEDFIAIGWRQQPYS
jgi:hypothetical protein